jgi:hypothetical protein
LVVKDRVISFVLDSAFFLQNARVHCHVNNSPILAALTSTKSVDRTLPHHLPLISVLTCCIISILFHLFNSYAVLCWLIFNGNILRVGIKVAKNLKSSTF